MASQYSTSETPKKTAGVIIIGDEIVKGQVLDTNSHFICKELYALGVKVVRVSAIRDGIDTISSEVRTFSSAYDIVITTGGIGPTHDDMTYAGVAKAFNVGTKTHPEMEAMIDTWLGDKGFKRDLIMRMAEMPTNAKLFFDPEGKRYFPIVAVNNVYVLPGVPQFVERMFPRLTSVLGLGEGNASNLFHTGQLYVAKDELSITHNIDAVAEKFKDTVIIGSYPVFGNLYYSTRITMESSNPENVEMAKEFLSEILPENSVVNFDPDPVKNADSIVYEIRDKPDHPLHQIVSQAVSTTEEALDKFPLENLWICFNGGKDCTALLHILHAVAKKKFPEEKRVIQVLCIRGSNPFPEMETFVQETAQRYNLKMWTYDGPILSGLRQAVAEHPELKAVLMGTRRSDPSGEHLAAFQMTDPDWPQLMRVSPMLEWKFADVWSFIRTLSLPYCPLYDQGYTSIGNRDNTVPNAALAFEENGKQKYRPAYTLPDCNEERNGRQ